MEVARQMTTFTRPPASPQGLAACCQDDSHGDERWETARGWVVHQTLNAAKVRAVSATRDVAASGPGVSAVCSEP